MDQQPWAEELAPAGTLADPLRHSTIGVFYGGPSSERDVSIRSGKAVIAALEEAGHTVEPLLLDGALTLAAADGQDIDVAFLALHGEFGEDGGIQRVLDQAGIPYTGSGADASSQAFDKVLAKHAFERASVLTPAWLSFDRQDLERWGGVPNLQLHPPVIIKPAASGSSLGVSLVQSEVQVAAAVEEAFKYGDTVLVERYVAGRELTVGVLGDTPLPVVEIETVNAYFDTSAKYGGAGTKEICPASLDEDVAAAAQMTALAAHQALGCRDVSRTDMLLDAQGFLWALEVNTLPGLTCHSLLPLAARTAGLSFTQLCEYLLRRALTRARVKAQAA